MSPSIGKHCIAELHACDVSKLNDETWIREALRQAAAESGSELIKVETHAFDPQGVTGVALLAESHLCIHTWPESGYAAIDCFTCGANVNSEKACRYLAAELGAKSVQLKTIKRGPGLPLQLSVSDSPNVREAF